MAEQQPFKWRHFEANIILVCVRWYLRYALSSRSLEEHMRERGLQVDHPTIYRGVQHAAPEREQRCHQHMRGTTNLWRVDETYVKVKGVGMYLYRTIDSQENTRGFLLSATRDAQAAERLFAKAFRSSHTVTPHIITVDKNAAYLKCEFLRVFATQPSRSQHGDLDLLYFRIYQNDFIRLTTTIPSAFELITIKRKWKEEKRKWKEEIKGSDNIFLPQYACIGIFPKGRTALYYCACPLSDRLNCFSVDRTKNHCRRWCTMTGRWECRKSPQALPTTR